MQLFSTVMVVDGEKMIVDWNFHGSNSHVDGRAKFNALVKEDCGQIHGYQMKPDIYKYVMKNNGNEGKTINLALIFAPEETDHPKTSREILYPEDFKV